MMLVVTGVGLLIHIYASEYMIEDKAYWRFFGYLNLFVFSMLVLILGDNLPVLFVGWEGVGLCSYLLIGFWYGKMPNATAGKKAFIANRIGDFGLLVAMFLLAVYCGALDWDGIARNAHELVSTADRPGPINLWPIGGGRFEDFMLAGIKLPLHKLQPGTPFTITGGDGGRRSCSSSARPARARRSRSTSGSRTRWRARRRSPRSSTRRRWSPPAST